MTGLPTGDELKQLPITALAAYAARCARRVQPLYLPPPDSQKHLTSVDRAIKVAQDYAANISQLYDVNQCAAAARMISVNTNAGRDAAKAAAETASVVVSSDSAVAACSVARVATQAASHVGSDLAAAEAARNDFDWLVKINLGGSGEDGESIDPTETGPLGPYWPKGTEPDWYQPKLEQMRGVLEEHHVAQESGTGVEMPAVAQAKISQTVSLPCSATAAEVELPPISVYIDPGNATAEMITEFYLALSAVYEAHGGSGLQIAKEEFRSFVGEDAV